MIVVLPNRLKRPAAGDTTRGSTITRQHEWGLSIECLYISHISAGPLLFRPEKKGNGEREATYRRIRSTSPPPISSGVYQRPPARLRMVRVDETPDPAHHAGVREPVACVARGAVFHV